MMTKSHTISLTNYSKNYNRLSDDVDKSFAHLLLRENYTEVIHEALSVIRSYDAAEFLGVLLLHRHFPATQGAVFLERRYTPRIGGHQTTLVTAPAEKRKLPVRIAPHRFRIDKEGKLQPLEFTTDRLAIKAWNRLQGNQKLLKDIGWLLAKRRFSSLLGIGIYCRESSVDAATRVYIEQTDFEKKMSVVHMLPRLPRVPGRLIPVLWTSQDAGNGCCTQACISYCSHPDAGIGYCGHRKGGHVGCV